MEWVLVIMWMLGGYSPITEEATYPDFTACSIALSNASINPAPQGDSHLVLFCKPKE